MPHAAVAGAVVRRAVRGVGGDADHQFRGDAGEVAYFTAALVLCGLLWAIYRAGPAATGVRAGCAGCAERAERAPAA